MGFRFRRSIKIAPGVKMNVGKRGISSVSVGGFTLGRRGVYYNFDFPGVGLSYRTKLLGGSKQKKKHTTKASATAASYTLALKEDGALVGLDSRGKPLSEAAWRAAKKEDRADMLAWLEEQAAAYNEETAALLTLHHDTPAPENKKLHLEYEAETDRWETAADQVTADSEIIAAILSGVLTEIEWPRETAVSFEIAENSVWLDVDLPEIEDLPTQEAHINKTKLAISLKDLTQKQQRLNYAQHIHAIGFRLIGDVLAHLPPISAVVFSGYSQRLNKQTAHTEVDYLYSVRIERDEWSKINFDNLAQLDVVACFERFALRRRLSKTGILSPIDPFAIN